MDKKVPRISLPAAHVYSVCGFDSPRRPSVSISQPPVLDNEALKCWGSNNYGSLGLGDEIPRGIAPGEMGDALPALDLTFGDGLGAVSNVFAGTLHTCVSGTEGGLACFGFNAEGQVRLAPRPIKWRARDVRS